MFFPFYFVCFAKIGIFFIYTNKNNLAEIEKSFAAD